MKKKSINEMSSTIGGSFWGGLACGATVGLAILDPTKVTVVIAVATCGWALD